MRQVFGALVKELKSGEAAVLATIVESRGSTPRKAGARMMVRQDGSSCGTVGGGAVEYQTTLAAAQALELKTSLLRSFCLSDEQAANIGMVCGGEVEVYLQYLVPEEADIRLCREILDSLEQNRSGFLVLDIMEDEQWKMTVTHGAAGPETVMVKAAAHDTVRNQTVSEVGTSFTAATAAGKGMKSYAFPLVKSGTVYIFGGGHVAQELVPVLSHLDFPCIVLDDRAEFSCAQVFPQAEQTLVVDLEDIGDAVTIGPADYVCIMTRGHQFDYFVQKQVMRRKPAYIGIMGSRNKIRVVTEKLLQDGFSKAEIEACHMPIGTDIKAETPAEIAISIAGELIAVRAMRHKAGRI